MREQPSAAELIEAVAEFLQRDLAPQVTGRAAFHARVAFNVLQIVRRELERGPDADKAEAARLAALLGRSGGAGALNEELCRRIATGEIDAGEPALIEHLWATTLDVVAVDQPSYATYRRESASAPSQSGDA